MEMSSFQDQVQAFEKRRVTETQKKKKISESQIFPQQEYLAAAFLFPHVPYTRDVM